MKLSTFILYLLLIVLTVLTVDCILFITNYYKDFKEADLYHQLK